jgi:hypothetical protein
MLKISKFICMRARNPFKGRSVWLIEAKNALLSESAFTAIGQLLYYEHHFKKGDLKRGSE